MAKTLEVWLKAYHETFAEHGIIPDDQSITSNVFGDWNGAKKLGVKDLETFNSQLIARVDQGLKTVELYDGAKDILVDLKSRSKKIALLSSSLKEYIEPALERHGIKDCFDLIIDGNEVENHKPHPEVILKAIEILDVDKKSSVMVGDSKSDLGAAQAAGVDSVLFYPDSHEIFYAKDDLLVFHPTFVVGSFLELEEVLR